MTQPMKRRCFALFLLTLLLVIASPGQDEKPLLGKWSMTSETGGDPVQWNLTIEQSGDKLTATTNTGEGSQPVKDLTYAAGLLKFKTPYDGTVYDIELKLIEGKLQGTWSGGGNSGQTSGTKD